MITTVAESSQAKSTPSGVGDFMKIGVAKLGYTSDGCGNCNQIAAEMNLLGPDGCQQEFERLVNAVAANSSLWKGITKPIIGSILQSSIDQSRVAARNQLKVFESQVQETLTEIQGPYVKHPPGWEVDPAVQEAHKRLMHAAVNTYSLPDKKFEGRGIITIAGGTKYFACGYMLIYQLRELGCKLPIQVWYLGQREMDNVQAKLLTDLDGVELVDATKVIGDKARILGGWQLKIWAIMESHFEEVLFLDSDNNPIRNPEYLFDDSQYREVGAVLWPDLLNEYGYDISAKAFELCELPVPTGSPKPMSYTPVESGQLLFNKSIPAVWHALQVVKHMNDHSDFWYREDRSNWYFYGDKSTFYLGFNATKTKYFVPRYCEWFGVTNAGGFRQYDFRGKPVFEHRCQPTSKVGLINPPNPEGITNSGLFMSAYNSLASKWTGTSWTYQQQSSATKDLATGEFGIWFNFGLQMNAVVELQRGRVRNGMGFHWSMDVSDESNPKLILVKGKTFYALTRSGDSWECPQGKLIKGPPKDFQIDHVGIENYIWCSLVHENEYQLPDSLEGQTVLDIGAHVGVFSKLCLDKGAKLVVSVEPSKKNYNRLVPNMRQYGERSVVFNKACWRSDVEDTTLLVATKTGDSGGYSVVATTDGEDVASVKLDALIDAFGPIDLLKIDCESAEWPILLTSERLGKIKRIVGEWHLARINDELKTLDIPGLPLRLPAPLGNENFYRRLLAERLGKYGFQVNFTTNPNTELLGLFFAERV